MHLFLGSSMRPSTEALLIACLCTDLAVTPPAGRKVGIFFIIGMAANTMCLNAIALARMAACDVLCVGDGLKVTWAHATAMATQMIPNES